MTTPMTGKDPFGARRTIRTAGGAVQIYNLQALSDAGVAPVERLPLSIRVLLESALRNVDGASVTEDDVRALAGWRPQPAVREIPFVPFRVILQDFTGVPAIVDLAAMRDAMARLGGDPRKINPLVPVDLVIDHSVQVDAFGSAGALGINSSLEFSRNLERYEFLRWGQQALANFRVVPPAMGIVHQVNLEYLSTVVATRTVGGVTTAMPDSVLGTDSHTPMVNGLGVAAWGVGGIEAEAVMLGQPLFMLLPQVVGFRMTGRLPSGATATDLVLTVTQILRQRGVVDKFVEFFGEGVGSMSLADRATISNMAPEYGATMGYFPIDGETLAYLRRTGRPAELVDLVERYTKEQGLFRTDSVAASIEYSDVLTLDLGTVEPSLAGPKRPQDRVPLSGVKRAFGESLRAPLDKRGYALNDAGLARHVDVKTNGSTSRLTHGSVVIAAITSCTNTSNPSVMIAAGLIARKACEKGLKPKPYVKTSLAPGSRVVTDYLAEAGLLPFLEQLGFHTVGYGCTTCIGNSGPLPDAIAAGLRSTDIVAASVLSGNRNFEGRVHPQVKANYLASPPLVVAYALAGRMDIDFDAEPLGTGADGSPVYLRDVWPDAAEVREAITSFVRPEHFHAQYGNVFSGNEEWNRISGSTGDTYRWTDSSTYIQNPPFFEKIRKDVTPIETIRGARVLVMVATR